MTRFVSHVIALVVGALIGRNTGGTSMCLSALMEKHNAKNIPVATTVATANAAVGTSERFKIASVNCDLIQEIPPVQVGEMASSPGAPYLVSFSWWDHRIKSNNFKNKAPVESNGSIIQIRNLLNSTPGVFVDVGANVGFMTNLATRDRQVYSIDPVSYDIAKLCEGYRANLARGFAQPHSLHLFHAAAGPSLQHNITITRPSDKVGKFDQSSLSRDAVFKSDVVEEYIPMITVDSIMPDGIPIAVVKIDVQGHEYGVLQGMKTILSRKSGYPRHVFYEDSAVHTEKAGQEVGACAKLLESFGYTCAEHGGDTLCSK